MLHYARKLRPFISIDREYKIRRGGYKVLNPKKQPIDALFHCCEHKTASQWIRLILSDPRFFMETGLMPYFTPSPIMRDPARRPKIGPKSVYCGLYIDHATLLALEKPKAWRAFVVTRDPRDLLVSRYFSARFSHRSSPKLESLRSRMSGLSDEQGLVYMIEEQFDMVAGNLLSYMNKKEAYDNYLIAKFEQLTGTNNVAHWSSMLRSLDLDVPEEKIASILKFYNFERLRPKRAAGKRTEKYGNAGRDWRSFFTPRVERHFNDRFGDLANRLGYE